MRQVLSLRSRLSRHPFSVINGAAEATGLPDTSVQVIMAVNTMHHWTDLAAACRELARIIQPRGRMLLVDENFEDPTHSGYEAWVARQHDRSSGHHFHMVDTARVASELERNGLVVPRHGQQRVAGEPAWVVEARRA